MVGRSTQYIEHNIDFHKAITRRKTQEYLIRNIANGHDRHAGLNDTGTRVKYNSEQGSGRKEY